MINHITFDIAVLILGAVIGVGFILCYDAHKYINKPRNESIFTKTEELQMCADSMTSRTINDRRYADKLETYFRLERIDNAYQAVLTRLNALEKKQDTIDKLSKFTEKEREVIERYLAMENETA